VFFFSSRRRHTRFSRDWSSDVCSSDLGWTWVLTRHGVHVSAIDNGPLRQHVLDTGLVEHLRADGFHWQPPRPLDWMVCDMVEQRSEERRVGKEGRSRWSPEQ